MTAVEHMHSQHYVHRDIKAENILFSTKDCSPILADFGFSINTDQHTKCQRMLGTVAYLAPELFSEEQEISPLDLYACDLFNLGVLFFIIVLGHPPFTYDRSERNWFLSTVKRGLWTHYWNLLKQTPERGFKEMIEGLLCFNPQGRWTMSSLKECAFFQGEMATKQEFQEYMNWKALLLNN
jgi:serine/threonine protein kinase